jgi:hypothetical protein
VAGQVYDFRFAKVAKLLPQKQKCPTSIKPINLNLKALKHTEGKSLYVRYALRKD